MKQKINTLTVYESLSFPQTLQWQCFIKVSMQTSDKATRKLFCSDVEKVSKAFISDYSITISFKLYCSPFPASRKCNYADLRTEKCGGAEKQ